MIKIKPFFGWGYDNFDRYSQQFHTRVGESVIGRYYVSSHNTYLTILVELGLVGFFFYLFPFGWWLLLTIRVWPRLPREGFWSRSLLAVLWLAVGAHIIPSNFLDMAYSPFGLTLWWLELALIADMIYPYLTPGDMGAPRWALRAIRSA
jgi:O-antigen ligase